MVFIDTIRVRRKDFDKSLFYKIQNYKTIINSCSTCNRS